MTKFLFSVVKFLGVVNRHGELKVINILVYMAMIKLWMDPPSLESFALIAISVVAKCVDEIVDMKKKRGLWDEMVKLQTLHNETVKWLSTEKAERDRKHEEFERDYTETKRAVALLNNRSVMAQMQGMTMAKKG